jgi:ABC-type branched-subunit amino acid transport system permease subunit
MSAGDGAGVGVDGSAAASFFFPKILSQPLLYDLVYPQPSLFGLNAMSELCLESFGLLSPPLSEDALGLLSLDVDLLSLFVDVLLLLLLLLVLAFVSAQRTARTSAGRAVEGGRRKSSMDGHVAS